MTISPPTHRPRPLGRRRSVERTTARRSPSARKRPGSGSSPLRLPAARVRRLGGWRDDAAATSAPRGLPRVWRGGVLRVRRIAASASSRHAAGTGERRLHRVAGATMLLAVTGAVGGLIAIASLSAAQARAAGRARTCSRPRGSFASSRAARAYVWREPTDSDGSRSGGACSERQVGQSASCLAGRAATCGSSAACGVAERRRRRRRPSSPCAAERAGRWRRPRSPVRRRRAPRRSRSARGERVRVRALRSGDGGPRPRATDA